MTLLGPTVLDAAMTTTATTTTTTTTVPPPPPPPGYTAISLERLQYLEFLEKNLSTIIKNTSALRSS